MTTLNPHKKAAIAGMDTQTLQALIDAALENERITDERLIALKECGLYFSTKLSNFEKSLETYRLSKSNRKREQTLGYARRDGDRVYCAFVELNSIRKEQELDSSSADQDS